jgi:pimeloyl-ACP methyl ester carboxylesterase
MIDKGVGFPVVIIPGIQGRWEWLAPAVEAMTPGHRVLSFSFDEVRPRELDGAFTAWMYALDKFLDRAHERSVSFVGVSFGGLVAAQYAARRPDRVTSLVLASTPAPVWHPNTIDRLCLRHPRLALPVFAARAAARLAPELRAARSTWPRRLALTREHGARILGAMASPVRMSLWAREWLEHDLTMECANITAPTLLITGESHLDRVVPVASTLEYLRLIRGSRHVILPGTGHIGVVTQPERFAEVAGQFIYASITARDAQLEAQAVAARTRHAS